jgi:hypothetical protein
MSDISDMLTQMGEALDAIPSEQKTKLLAEKAKELVELDETIKKLEDTVKTLKEERYDLQTKTLPDIMNEIGVENIGVSGVNVALTRKVHANISKDWEDDKKQRAFEHLRELHGEDLIKSTLSVSAGKSSDEKMRMLTQRVQQILAELQLDASVTLEPTVAWNSLTAFVKEVLKHGDYPVQLDLIGATNMPFVEIIRKKER